MNEYELPTNCPVYLRETLLWKNVTNRAVEDIDWQHVRNLISEGREITNPQLLADLLSLVDWRIDKEGGAG